MVTTPISDKPDGKRRRRWLTWTWIAVTMLALYPLSIGPVAAIVDHTSGHLNTVVNCEWLHDIYAPLLGFADNPTFGRPLAAFLNLCARRTYVPYAEYKENRGIVTATFDHPPNRTDPNQMWYWRYED
jgi:hypothetical protein